MSKIKILIVEDDVLIAEDLKYKLDKMGYLVAPIFNSAKDVLENLKKINPDIILLDIKLPGKLNGIDVSMKIRKEFKIPVIYLTAYSETRIVEQAKKTEPFGYLIKPFDIKELKVAIEMAIYKNKMEQKLIKSEERHRIISELSTDYFYTLVPTNKNNFDVEWISGAYKRVTGYSKSEMLDYNKWKKQIHPEDKRQITNSLKALIKKDIVETNYRLIRKDGNILWISEIKKPIRDKKNTKIEKVFGSVHDITENVKAEKLQKIIYEISKAVHTTSDMNDLYKFIRQLLSNIIDTSNFYIALSDDNNSKISFPYFADQKDNFTTYPKKKTLTSYVLKTAKPLIIKEKEIRELIEKGKINSVGTISKVWMGAPLKLGKEVIGAVIVQSYKDPNQYTSNDLKLLTFVSDEIAFAIKHKQAEEERDKGYKTIKELLEQLVSTLTVTIERRDPYTAGHQYRVSVLAEAIAKELNLSNDQIEGIRISALIHDIGKITIPSEILTKPGKLTDLEFNMIKMHPQEGYNIIKDINFPWNVADTILMHHERLDGSGYPKSLKGDEIILEARILAVSDVVEAMSSHRPYRPSKGTKKALEEIKKNKNKLYDPKVVDACLKLFIEKDFEFPEKTSSA